MLKTKDFSDSDYLEELTEKLKELCDDYPELEFLFLIRDDGMDWNISGNVCMVCAQENLTDFINETGKIHMRSHKKAH